MLYIPKKIAILDRMYAYSEHNKNIKVAFCTDVSYKKVGQYMGTSFVPDISTIEITDNEPSTWKIIEVIGNGATVENAANHRIQISHTGLGEMVMKLNIINGVIQGECVVGFNKFGESMLCSYDTPGVVCEGDTAIEKPIVEDLTAGTTCVLDDGKIVVFMGRYGSVLRKVIYSQNEDCSSIQKNRAGYFFLVPTHSSFYRVEMINPTRIVKAVPLSIAFTREDSLRLLYKYIDKSSESIPYIDSYEIQLISEQQDRSDTTIDWNKAPLNWRIEELSRAVRVLRSRNSYSDNKSPMDNAPYLITNNIKIKLA